MRSFLNFKTKTTANTRSTPSQRPLAAALGAFSLTAVSAFGGALPASGIAYAQSLRCELKSDPATLELLASTARGFALSFYDNTPGTAGYVDPNRIELSLKLRPNAEPDLQIASYLDQRFLVRRRLSRA